MPGEPNPFAVLEQTAQRQALAERAAQALAVARSGLILGRRPHDAFFATLALRLRAEPDWNCPTAATDGQRLLYHPAWFAALPAAEAQGVIAHEVLHCALAHQSRRQGRDPSRWNVAADLSVNPILLESGYALPAGRLMPAEGPFVGLPRGRSAEAYYALLPAEDPSGGSGPGPADDPGGCGAVREPGAGSPAETRQSAAEWQVAVTQARQVAQRRGSLPVGVDRLIEAMLRPAVAWRDVLRAFISRNARNDYSWSPPNRRFVHAGLYLPGLRSVELGDVVLAVDTSGSIGPELLDRFAAEAQGILDAYDCRLVIVYHDRAVQRVDTWQPSDGPLQLHPVGGGGTDHRPVFAHIEREGWNPTCLVCLTDLESIVPAVAPAYPVLWAVVGGNGPPPFGTLITIP